MRPCVPAAHDDAERFIKTVELSLRGGHAPERLRYKFDKALDFDLFEIAPPLEVLLQNRKDKAASIARKALHRPCPWRGARRSSGRARKSHSRVLVERIAPQEIYYV